MALLLGRCGVGAEHRQEEPAGDEERAGEHADTRLHDQAAGDTGPRTLHEQGHEAQGDEDAGVRVPWGRGRTTSQPVERCALRGEARGGTCRRT